MAVPEQGGQWGGGWRKGEILPKTGGGLCRLGLNGAAFG